MLSGDPVLAALNSVKYYDDLVHAATNISGFQEIKFVFLGLRASLLDFSSNVQFSPFNSYESTSTQLVQCLVTPFLR